MSDRERRISLKESGFQGNTRFLLQSAQQLYNMLRLQAFDMNQQNLRLLPRQFTPSQLTVECQSESESGGPAAEDTAPAAGKTSSNSKEPAAARKKARCDRRIGLRKQPHHN